MKNYVDIRNFVDINISHHESVNKTAINDTVILFTQEGQLNNDEELIKSYSEWQTKHPDTSDLSLTEQYVSYYFNDYHGNKLYILYGYTKDKIVTIVNKLKAIDVKYSVVGWAVTDNTNTHTSAYYQEQLAKTYYSDNNMYGIMDKIFLTVYYNDDLSDNNLLLNTNTDDKGIVGKYVYDIADKNGVEMSIGAYLSQLNFEGTDTIQDYDFTLENDGDNLLEDTSINTIITKHLNTTTEFAGKNRNIGGDMIDGTDLVNQYSSIILQQTCTNVLLNLLSQKIKGQTGIDAMYSVLTQELQKYVTNGYLTTDKICDFDYTVNVNNVDYTIIKKNTPLSLGYQITILPYSSLSANDINKHKAPNVYLVLAESYGVRLIKVYGNTF